MSTSPVSPTVSPKVTRRPPEPEHAEGAFPDGSADASRASSTTSSRTSRASWRPVIDSVYPLCEAAAAHERLDTPGRFGKIVLAIDESRL